MSRSRRRSVWTPTTGFRGRAPGDEIVKYACWLLGPSGTTLTGSSGKLEAVESEKYSAPMLQLCVYIIPDLSLAFAAPSKRITLAVMYSRAFRGVC